MLNLILAAVLASPQQPAELTRLAREAVIAEVEGRPEPKPQASNTPLPVFVTIERGGKVIGCRGSLLVRHGSLEKEVIAAARSAAKHDPRYGPIGKQALQNFRVTVTLVKRLEPIRDVNGLGPDDGLVLQAGTKTGVVLPWEGKDPKVRLEWAYKKAGVSPGSSAKLFRLKGERYTG